MWSDVPGKIHGVSVQSGDLIFGDVDGVLVVPGEHVETALEKAFEKVSGECGSSKTQEGQTLEQIFADHGIL